ncbi:MAG: flagellar biosynthesis protein FlgA, partial [Alphaproteobacteria bacterium]|nr:flagellar biosynthesis protein FlgA [Alphaproteobacteria bacterium]
PTDTTGRYAAMYKPFHLIGMELSVSVLSAALRGEPTGTTRAWRGDAVAVAKRSLAAGEILDGEGGYTVWGKACPAAISAREAMLPIGLAHRVRVRRDVVQGEVLRMVDVDLDESATGVRLRRQMLTAAEALRAE